MNPNISVYEGDKLNRKNKVLVEKINDLSCAIEGLCNLGWHIDKELYGHDIYIYGGKILKSKLKWEKSFEKGDFVIEHDDDGNILSNDFRDWNRIDIQIPKYTFDMICFRCKEVYHEHRNDEFILYVGAAINLYYISGIHTVLGDFDIDKLNSFIIEKQIREYLTCLCNCIRARVWLYAKAIHDETAGEHGIELKSGEILSEMIVDDKKNVNYLPDIIYYEKNADNIPEDLEILHKNLIKICPEYRMGQIYMCIADVKDAYTNDSMKKSYIKYAGILGIDFYMHVVGKPKLFDITFCIIDGKLEIDTSFDESFGLGIPYLIIRDGLVCYTEKGEYVVASKELIEDLDKRLDDDIKTWTYDEDPEMQKVHEQWLKDMEEDEENYVYTFADVRKSMEPYLGFGEVLDRPPMSEYIQGIVASYSGEYDNLSFKEFFQKLVYDSGRSEREIAKTVGFNETYTNSVINGKVKEPTTNTLLTFAISLRLSFVQTQVMLRKAGRCISERDDINGKKERMLADYINNGIYDIMRINMELDAAGLPILGAKDRL